MGKKIINIPRERGTGVGVQVSGNKHIGIYNAMNSFIKDARTSLISLNV